MSRWQWRWVLLDEEYNGLETLDQYDEEWQLALIKLQISTSLRKHLTLAFPNTTPQTSSFLLNNGESINVYSLTPVFQYGRREYNRVQQLVLEINTTNKTFAMGSSNESIEILTASDNIVDAVVLRLRSLLFPPIELVYRNFHGRKLIIAANQNEPYFKVSDPECRHGPVGSCKPVEGTDYNLIKVIGKALNFR